MAETSPAVERAELAARALADERADAVRLGDWLVGLLQEEWGRPADLVGKLGLELQEILERISLGATSSPLAPDPISLMANARNYSMVLCGEPSLTTDFLM